MKDICKKCKNFDPIDELSVCAVCGMPSNGELYDFSSVFDSVIRHFNMPQTYLLCDTHADGPSWKWVQTAVLAKHCGVEINTVNWDI